MNDKKSMGGKTYEMLGIGHRSLATANIVLGVNSTYKFDCTDVQSCYYSKFTQRTNLEVSDLTSTTNAQIYLTCGGKGRHLSHLLCTLVYRSSKNKNKTKKHTEKYKSRWTKIQKKIKMQKGSSFGCGSVSVIAPAAKLINLQCLGNNACNSVAVLGPIRQVFVCVCVCVCVCLYIAVFLYRFFFVAIFGWKKQKLGLPNTKYKKNQKTIDNKMTQNKIKKKKINKMRYIKVG